MLLPVVPVNSTSVVSTLPDVNLKTVPQPFAPPPAVVP